MNFGDNLMSRKNVTAFPHVFTFRYRNAYLELLTRLDGVMHLSLKDVPSLFQIRVDGLVGVKLLSEPMLAICQFKPYGQIALIF